MKTSTTLKRKHAHHNKTAATEKKPRLTLKAFAEQLSKSDKPEDQELVKTWRANKLGAQDKPRSDASLKRIALEKAATRTAKRK